MKMIDKRLFRESKEFKTYVPLNVAASILNAFFTGLSAYFLSKTIESIFIEKYSLEFVSKYVIGFMIIACTKILVNILIDIRVKNTSEKIKEGLKVRLIDKVASSNPLKVKNERHGELIYIFTEGIDKIVPYFSEYIPQLINSVIIPILIALGVFSVDKLSGLIMLLTYPIIPLFMKLIGYKSKEVNEKQWKKLSLLSSHFLDMLQGLSTLKVFGRSKLQEEKVYEVSESCRKATMEVLRISFLSAFVLELSATISTAVIAVSLGLRLVYNKISFLSAFFILILTPDFYLPLRQLGLKFHASLNGQVAMEKIEELEKFLEEKENSCCVSLDGPIRIEVKNLSYIHENKEAVRNISFTINAGEKAALIGESGSGKSTLVNILCKFLEVQRGAVFVNGIDINDIKREDYLKNVALVPQFPYIFNKSIEENIVLDYKENAEGLIDIYKKARIDRFAEHYIHRFSTIIGHGEETNVSGGEGQRIAIARALYKNASLLILDEPTSAMDPDTEEMLSEVIKNLSKDKTVLLSAHRLNTLKNTDKVLVMKEGKLIESGTPKELMLKKGYYYSLIKIEEQRVYEGI